MGILLLYDLELPWLMIISLFIREITWSGTKVELFLVGTMGTLFYSLTGAVVIFLLDRLKHMK